MPDVVSRLNMGRIGLRGSLGRAKHTAWWRRTRPQAIPWGRFLLVLLLVILTPTAVYVWLSRVWPGAMITLHYLVSTVYAVTCIAILGETWAAWRGSNPPGPPCDAEALPFCTTVIAAYLPNEQDIILETLAHHLARVNVPADRFEVILAYNTPHALEVEDALRELAERDGRLRLLRVVDSRSKAENVNAALAEARGEIVGVYDADHWPEPDCYCKAWRWLAHGYDAVQGRCVIRNFSENWLTRTVGIEFDCIYAVAHQGRAALSRTAIFGGSNGYWRRNALCDEPLNPDMLTEDIDVSVRTLLAGRRMAHDRTIMSEELAPTRLRFWLFQRKRWSQGWLEVTLRHLGSLLRSRNLTPWQKTLWLYLLAWGALFPFLSMQVLPLVLAALIRGWSIPWLGNTYFVVTSAITLASGPLLLLVAYLRGGRSIRRPGLAGWYLLYGTVGILYTSLKTVVTLVAHFSHLMRECQWVTTPRTTPESTS